MKGIVFGLGLFVLVAGSPALGEASAVESEATSECLVCHESLHPGIVEEWRKSRHGQVTPAAALAVKGLGLKVSGKAVPEGLKGTIVGCAECHTLRSAQHADTFDHNGHPVHVAVSPADCAVCHTEESDQFSRNLMSHARIIFVDNPVYGAMRQTINGRAQYRNGNVTFEPSDEATEAESCLNCHGTKLEFKGLESRDTDMGPMEFPVIAGWPNQGVGRENLDGSLGACSACHTRHQFSIEVARKPYTCKECHVGPDVPAYKVYEASKHGNIFSSLEKEWNFSNVPWTIGRDFTAPTCAGCHVSLVTGVDGTVVNRRTHQMNDRLPWRLFGLVYAHPHPKSADTRDIRNKDGLPLPTDFGGGLATGFLIDPAEQKARAATMQKTCLGCHDASWVSGFWNRLENTIRTTNDATRTATEVMSEAWTEGFARGLAVGGNPFDEAVERKWCDLWLFYANTTRLASAMAGGGDYGVFADGRYHMSKTILDLHDWLGVRRGLGKKP